MTDEDYPTCRKTFATLRAFSPSVTAAQISEFLSVQPTSSHSLGDPIGENSATARQQHGWFLSTEEFVMSRDSREHINWVLDRVEAALDGFAQLKADGVRLDVLCYWESMDGHGGPMLDPGQMGRLANLGLSCGWDVYFNER